MTTQQQQQHCTPKGLLRCTAMSEPQAGCRNTLRAASYRELQRTESPPGLAGGLPDGTTPFTSTLHCQPWQPPFIQLDAADLQLFKASDGLSQYESGATSHFRRQTCLISLFLSRVFLVFPFLLDLVSFMEQDMVSNWQIL